MKTKRPKEKLIVLLAQVPAQLVSRQIRTRGPICFKFIIALIMPSTKLYK